MKFAGAFVLSASAMAGAARINKLARTPPMGWMSWEIFRCNIDCAKDPETCISDKFYRLQVDGLSDGGYVDAGYKGIHMDDCWEQKKPPRDTKTGELVPEPTRFPNGMKSLGDYIHSKNATFGLYTAESHSTCGGYPASADNEDLDAKTFAKWGVDYMKVDGCGPASYYEHGYKAMGAALENSGRDIVYSCSWPAYTGSDESTKPFDTYIADGCNLWRNYADIQCNWGSLSGIIEHWGKYCRVLQPHAGPGHWHDMDMLLIGNGCVSHDEERTQMALWSILASPLIMGNDLRNGKVSDVSKAILLNKDAIAVSQDPLGKMGLRLGNTSTPTQIWARELSGGAVAVALYNAKGDATPLPPIPTGNCATWHKTTGGYLEACGGTSGNVGSFSDLTVAEAEAGCCGNPKCAGFSFSAKDPNPQYRGSGYYKGNANCGMTKGDYTGYYKPSQVPATPSTPTAVDITVTFAEVGLSGDVEVYDIWAQKSLGFVSNNGADGSYTAKQVPFHGSAFLRLTPKK